MKIISVLLIIFVLISGCSSAKIAIEVEEPRNQNNKLPEDFIPPNAERHSERIVSFSFMDNNTVIPKDVAVAPECSDKNKQKICYKRIIYQPEGFDRQLEWSTAKNAALNSISFVIDSLGSQNYCFRVVMFDDVTKYKDYTEYFDKKKVPDPSHPVESEQWYLDGCDAKAGPGKQLCKAWNSRKQDNNGLVLNSPFVEIVNGKIERKYIDSRTIASFFPTAQNFKSNETVKDIFYAIEGKKKTSTRCPSATSSGSGKKLFPERMSGDPRVRIIRV